MFVSVGRHPHESAGWSERDLESLRELKDDDSDAEHALAVMDEALAFLQGGLDALRGTAA